MKEQLKKGEERECELDEYFSPDWIIYQLSRVHEGKGLGDRIYVSKGDSSNIWLIEYKADEKAAETGNVFVETVSVDTAHKMGWVVTCQADFIFVYIPANRVIFIVKPDDMRKALPVWQSKYPIRPSDPDLNDGYVSYGVLVPIIEIEKISVRSLTVEENETDQTVKDILASGWV